MINADSKVYQDDMLRPSIYRKKTHWHTCRKNTYTLRWFKSAFYSDISNTYTITAIPEIKSTHFTCSIYISCNRILDISVALTIIQCKTSPKEIIWFVTLNEPMNLQANQMRSARVYHNLNGMEWNVFLDWTIWICILLLSSTYPLKNTIVL